MKKIHFFDGMDETQNKKKGAVFLILLLSILFLSAVSTSFAAANRSVSFIDAVDQMVSNSPEYQSALQSIEVDKASVQSGLYSHYPTFSGQLSHGMNGAWASTPAGNGESSEQSSASVSMALPVFRFGADQATLESSQVALRAAQVSAKTARIRSEAAMAMLLIDEIRSRKQVIFEDSIFRSRTVVLEKAESLFKRGLLPAEELEKIQLDAGVASIQLLEVKTAALNNRRQAETAYGAPLGDVAWAWEAGFFSKFEQWNVGAFLDRNLQIALEDVSLELKKAELALARSRAERFPTLDFASTVAKVFPTENGTPRPPATWSMQLMASVPLFSRFESSSRVEASVSAVSAAKFKWAERERVVRENVSKTASSLRDRVVAARNRATFLKRAWNNLTRARERFLAGKISSNDLSLDERRVFELELTQLSNEADLQKDFVQLCSALTLPLRECALNLN